MSEELSRFPIRQHVAQWKKLPEITGRFDFFGGPVEDPDAANPDNFPRLDESTQQALKESKITFEALSEVIIDVYQKAVNGLIDRNVYYKNEQNQFLYIRFPSNGDYSNDCTVITSNDPEESECLYKDLQPVITFIESIEEAVSHSILITEDVSHLPRNYFI